MSTAVLRFGQYLVSRGLVTEENILNALNLQMKQIDPFGMVAHRLGKLTLNQIMEILNAQAPSHKLFEEIAVDLGYLRQDEVDYISQMQKKGRLPIGEILILMKVIDRRTLERELEAYVLRMKTIGSHVWQCLFLTKRTQC